MVDSNDTAKRTRERCARRTPRPHARSTRIFLCRGSLMAGAAYAPIARDRRRDRRLRRVGSYLGGGASREGTGGHAIGAVPHYPAPAVRRVRGHRAGRRRRVGTRQRDGPHRRHTWQPLSWQPPGTKKPACARPSATGMPPTPSPARTPVARPFSLARAIKNKEHKAVAGLAVVGAMLAAKAFFLP